MPKSQSNECPDRRLITDYLAGRLEDAAAERFETHLESCECCVAALSMTPTAEAEPTWLGMARERARFNGSTALTSQLPLQVDDHVKDVKDTNAGPNSVRYTWIRRIGAGGMGEVWEGWDHMMRRPVALKKLRQEHMENDGTQRLFQEAIVLSRLSHPHIVTVHEVTIEHSQPVLVMEFIPGMTLADWQSGRPLRQRDAAEVASVLAQALQHAHAHSVIHRDLKPSNVLLRTDTRADLPRDENGHLCLWLSDFGLARAIDGPSFTSVGQVLGTPFYMAPEQAADGAVDVRSDIYGLGAILYELLTGIPPFMGNDKAVLLQRIQTEEPVAPRRLQPRLSRDIETICLKCLARRPSDRYCSATAVAADLAAFLEGRPILARPVGVAARLLRWCTRNPIIAGLTLSTATAVLSAAAFAVAAAQEQMQTLRTTIMAAEREKALRERAESAEQAATQREQNESRLRQQYQTLLLKIIGIIDETRLATSNPVPDNAGPSSHSGSDAKSVTQQLLDAVIPLIEQSGNQPSWSEFEIAARFLALNRFQPGPAKFGVLIEKVDQGLSTHENNPEDPCAYVEFLWTRQHFFDVRIEFEVDVQNKYRQWRRLADLFLRQARACAPQDPRIDKFLAARAQALGRARDIWGVLENLTVQGRFHAQTALHELVDDLKQPIPHTSRSPAKEQQLLKVILEEIITFASDAGGTISP
jgi:tRNA A-37 threonylcarbamoyl transferase component Bud32/anti-sigma factor RsiW